MRPGPKRDLSSWNEMVRLFRSGLTCREIAERRGVSRQAVNSVIRRSGFGSMDGGHTLKARIKRECGQQRRNAEYLEKYGYGVDEMRKFRRLGVVLRFRQQKRNAGKRGVRWELTFRQWWEAWQASGFWEERGRPGYCMARKGDKGPYAVGNIYFCTIRQNFEDGRIFRKKATLQHMVAP